MTPPTPTPDEQEKEKDLSRMDGLARFWAKVQRGSDEQCWNWTGAVMGSGYGNWASGRPRRTFTAHRLAFELISGVEIPPLMVLDHLCRNKLCCNPKHLEIVTERVNVVDRGNGPTAINARKTHCPSGHELSGNNLRVRRGRRECRACIREQLRDQWARGARKRGNGYR